MKILIAPDSFKESLDAAGVASAIAAGWRDAMPQAELIELPLADGGEGTTAALVAATGGEWIPCRVSGPLGTPVDGFWGRLDARRAVVECAAASGLDQVPRELRDPWRATTRGLGELILAALDTGVREIIVGLGGSATNDGGAGMLQALGAQLLDQQGSRSDPVPRGCRSWPGSSWTLWIRVWLRCTLRWPVTWIIRSPAQPARRPCSAPRRARTQRWWHGWMRHW